METQGTDDLQKKVSGASPVELVIILYDGALRFLDNCRKLWLEGNDKEAAVNLTKAANIVLELQSSLKADKGAGDSLSAVYDKVQSYLGLAQETKNAEYLDFVEKILAELKETWVKVNQD